MADPDPASTPDRRADFLIFRLMNQLATRWATPGSGRVGVCSPLVGVVSGLGAVAFLLLLDAVVHGVLGEWMGLRPPPTGEGTPHPIAYPATWWLVLLIPTVGGLISGLIVFTWAPEAEGHGTDALIRAFHRGGGQIRGRVPLIKGLSSIITIGSGGSAGSEGPIAQVGAGFGSLLAGVLKLTPDERRLLMLAGAAGGIGAIFRAPLGGALFACEVLYMTAAMESAALLPCLASAIVAYSTFAVFITPRPIFIVPDLEFHGLLELPLFAMLGLACAGVGWLYVRVFYGMRDHLFRPLPLPKHVKPAIGGLLLGIMALAFPQLMTGGYGWVQWGAIGLPPSLVLPGESVFDPGMGVWLLLSLALLKTAATGLTISSGGSGGVFGPSIFIGGMLGGALGQLLDAALPTWDLNPAAFALVGMGGFFAGVSKAPLASIVLVCEMSGSYSLLVPLMLVCGLNVGLSRHWTIYEEQVASPVDSPAHQGDFVVDVLERLRVDQVRVRTEGLEIVPEATPFSQVVRRVARSSETLFPVVDDEGLLTGIFSLRDVRLALLGTGNLGALVVADDIARSPMTVTPEDDLHTALKRMTELNVDELPVVPADGPNRLIGLLGRKDLVRAYTAQIEALRAPAEPTAA
ncbi:chloride channel protein [Tautonia marina]|uniref:chloride channel protein n=1 Tax=Tautonia marina TaxID=2653855 RepID=UPI00126050A7|nr:chloride channel protein [Tautonia marina]